jgi:3-oxoadipate enol-lactonase
MITRVQNGEATLHVEVEGPEDGAPLLLSNSLGTTLEMWSPQIAALVQTHRVARYDTRGHGRSNVPPGEYTMDQLGKDALAIADALGWERFDVCGLSMGGMTALWLGIHAPERIRRLVCSSAAPFTGGPHWDSRMQTVREGGMAAVAPMVVSRWFTPEFAGTSPEAIGDVERQLTTMPADGYIGCCAALRDMDLRPGLSSISARTLLLAGSHDLGPPPAVVHAMAKQIAGSRVVELNGAHLCNIEDPLLFTSTVSAFLSTP